MRGEDPKFEPEKKGEQYQEIRCQVRGEGGQKGKTPNRLTRESESCFAPIAQGKNREGEKRKEWGPTNMIITNLYSSVCHTQKKNKLHGDK